MERPLADKKLQIHVSGSFRGYSPEGRMMDKVIDTRAGGKVLEKRRGEGSITIPTYDEIKQSFESIGINVERLQTPSLEVISVGGVPGDPNAEVHSNVGSIVTLEHHEISHTEIYQAMDSLGDGFDFSRIEAEIEGSTFGGPRPFASEELELLIKHDGGVLSMESQANMEANINEKTPDGYRSINPDIKQLDNTDLVINLRDKEVFSGPYTAILTEVLPEEIPTPYRSIIRVA